MSRSLTSVGDDAPQDELLAARMRSLIEAAHAQWAALAERRRMRAFGFRPAVEPGVLKREWEKAEVRISNTRLSMAEPDGGHLLFSTEDRTLSFEGSPFLANGDALAAAEALMRLIHEYERWVEAREGRQQRIERGGAAGRDRGPFNALAEVRRLQRNLQARRR